jgi:hypothetical protein
MRRRGIALLSHLAAHFRAREIGCAFAACTMTSAPPIKTRTRDSPKIESVVAPTLFQFSVRRRRQLQAKRSRSQARPNRVIMACSFHARSLQIPWVRASVHSRSQGLLPRSSQVPILGGKPFIRMLQTHLLLRINWFFLLNLARLLSI